MLYKNFSEYRYLGIHSLWPAADGNSRSSGSDNSDDDNAPLLASINSNEHFVKLKSAVDKNGKPLSFSSFKSLFNKLSKRQQEELITNYKNINKPIALLYLVHCYMLNKNFKALKSAFDKGIESKNASVIFAYSECLRYGKYGFNLNLVEAEKYLKIAADLQHAPSMYKMARAICSQLPELKINAAPQQLEDAERAKKLALESAKLGYWKGMVLAKELLTHCDLIEQDYTVALEFSKKIALLDDDELDHESRFKAIEDTVLYYEQGSNDVEQNFPRALKWLEKFALLDNDKITPTARLKIIKKIIAYKEEGRAGVEKNYPEALVWLLKVVQSNNNDYPPTELFDMMKKIISYFEEGREGIQQNYPEALDWLLKVVQSNNYDFPPSELFAMMQKIISYLEEGRDGIEKSYSKAYNYLVKFAEHTKITSISRFEVIIKIISYLKLGRDGVAISYPQAIAWGNKLFYQFSDDDFFCESLIKELTDLISLIRKNGNRADESHDLTLLYKNLKQVCMIDQEEANLYFNSKIINKLGEYFERGEFCPINNMEAYLCYCYGEEHGNLDARESLGRIFLQGNDVVPQNKVEAFKFLSKCKPERLSPQHAYILALMYRDGEYSNPNEMKYIKLLTLAADAGHADAAYELAENYFYEKYGLKRNEKDGEPSELLELIQDENDDKSNQKFELKKDELKYIKYYVSAAKGFNNLNTVFKLKELIYNLAHNEQLNHVLERVLWLFTIPIDQLNEIVVNVLEYKDYGFKSIDECKGRNLRTIGLHSLINRGKCTKLTEVSKYQNMLVEEAKKPFEEFKLYPQKQVDITFIRHDHACTPLKKKL